MKERYYISVRGGRLRKFSLQKIVLKIQIGITTQIYSKYKDKYKSMSIIQFIHFKIWILKQILKSFNGLMNRFHISY